MACANAIKYWTQLEQMKREKERDGVSVEKLITNHKMDDQYIQFIRLIYQRALYRILIQQRKMILIRVMQMNLRNEHLFNVIT